MAANNPNFDQMDENPVCLQIPWTVNPEWLKKWEQVSMHFLSFSFCEKLDKINQGKVASKIYFSLLTNILYLLE